MLSLPVSLSKLSTSAPGNSHLTTGPRSAGKNEYSLKFFNLSFEGEAEE